MAKPIFNSLGSNYSFGFAMLAFAQIFGADKNALTTLRQKLADKFQGDVTLVYKGRDAIEFALGELGIGGSDQVLTQAFTCHAIEEAIIRTGAEPTYVDLGKNELNPTLETLNAALKKSPNVRAVLIQHTLGYPAHIKQIRDWCDKHKIYLIEDLAQAFGAKDEDGVEVGTYADVVICSFGRDKIIDAVAGGATIVKVPTRQQTKITKYPGMGIVLRDMIYPILTWKIRAFHQVVIGKVLFQIAKKVHLLTSPIESQTSEMTLLPAAYAVLALKQLHELDQQLEHRRKIASIYQHKLHAVTQEISNPVHMRYPFSVEKPDEITKSLQQKQIYITDRWYRKAVDFGSLNKKTVYQNGSCPNAEKLVAHIINLPTHRGITPADAERILCYIK